MEDLSQFWMFRKSTRSLSLIVQSLIKHIFSHPSFSSNYRKAQEEIAALSQMAEQFNSKMASSNNTSSTEIQSVDLDNLFSFLSDVQSTKSNQIIDEIGEKMNELVENLDVELESVIQQELEEKAKLDQKKSPMIEEAEKNQINAKKGPSLPEPTEPPPPPPPPPQFANGTANRVAKSNEPIYESVLPRDENEPTSPIINGNGVHTNGELANDAVQTPHITKEPQEIKKVRFAKQLVPVLKSFHILYIPIIKHIL